MFDELHQGTQLNNVVGTELSKLRKVFCGRNEDANGLQSSHQLESLRLTVPGG